jgi:prepilin-type N-terminal cleavage/methylation domain-containing protein/prepilin-type processing-associated H-X9-DG protein
MKKDRKGFTLTELLVVIAIISILTTLLSPSLSRMLGRSRATDCANNLHQLGIAIQLYAQENNQKYPMVEPLPSNPIDSANPLPSLKDALLKYAGGSDKVFRCRRDKTRWPVEGASYEWCYSYGDDLVDAPKVWMFNRPLDKATLLWDYDNVHSDQGSKQSKNILFADGHVGGI